MDIEKIADELIGMAVIGAGVAGGAYMTYLSGAVPEFLIIGFGLVLGFYFNKVTRTQQNR